MSDSNSDQIRSVLTDEEKADRRFEKFTDLFKEISGLPDAERRLYQAQTVLELLAGGTNGIVDFIPNMPDEPQGRMLSDEEADELIEDLFGVSEVMEYSEEADELAGALMKIIDMLAYERSLSVRESNKNFLDLAIYSRTRDCCERMGEFFAKAARV